jgi:RNA polymerase sigma factor (TIGR02999 family)
MGSRGEITLTLERLRAGEPDAQSQLVHLVYDELRRIASSQLRRERTNHTLQSTALVHEVYVRMLGKERSDWRDRAHFFSAAACAMRHILVDHARSTRAQRRGGGAVKVEMTEFIAGTEARTEEILAVDEALQKLGRVSPRQEMIVEMRFYAGYTEEEIAEILQLSERTVKREWAVAKAWLHGAIHGDAGGLVNKAGAPQ